MERTSIILLLLSLCFLHFTGATIRNLSFQSVNKKNVLEVEGPIKDVLAQTNGTAVLPCRIPDPAIGVVTWVRRRDRQLLTVGSETHSMDSRFVVRPSAIDWTLTIRNVKYEDAGLYECQIPTDPISHNFVRLTITEAYSVIPGGPDLHVKQGSSLRLECQLLGATEPPTFMFWYRQERMINYDAEPGVKVDATKNGSVLIVDKTKLSHGGNYTCQPSNARASSVMIHVIEEEEKPAAMHSGDSSNSSPDLFRSLMLAFFFGLVAAVRRYTTCCMTFFT
ncbi:zwei Ig domain protein zig-8-like [Chelonus insularis]|uniref:zwei Ig domain protein zig-8-like n=1 Tax=Chelonus insularis TaxID=460826 RepID=UPI00158F21B2|nr:zwei Ig domain protein zig-8-like [Chelonus insularis]